MNQEDPVDRDKESPSYQSENLRKRALEILEKREVADPPVNSPSRDYTLVHDLQVRQIELEIQNEELKLAKEKLRKEYADAYVTLQESEKKYRSVFDLANDAIMLHTLTTPGMPGRFIDMNRTTCRMLGYTREELLTLGPADIVPVEYHSQIYDIIRRTTSCDSFLFETFFMRKDGTRFPIESSAHLIDYGGKKIWISVVRDISERKAAANALEESEERFRTLARNLPGIVYRLHISPDGNRMEFFNDQVPVLTGYSVEELKQGRICSLEPFILPEDLDRVCAVVKESITRKTPFEVEYRFRHNSGKICTFVGRGRPAVNADGKVISIDGIIMDITGRRQAEEELRRSHEHYRQLIENISEVIFSLDLQGVITYISPVADRLYGYSPGEVIGKHFGSFIHPDDLPVITDAFSRRDEGACSELVFRILTKDGTGRYVRVTETPFLVDGKTAGFNYVMADITDRKQTEEALIESEEFNRGLVENLPDFIVIYDMKGIIRYANTAALECIGLPASKIIGTYAPSYIPGSNYGEIERKMRARLSGEPIPPYEIDIKGKNSNTVTVILRGSSITYMKEPCVLLVMTDISVRKRAEEALFESEKRYRTLFEESPVSLWEEDASGVKSWIDERLAEGITDLNAFFGEHPEDLKKCAKMVKVAKINAATRAMYGAQSEEEFIAGIGSVITEDSYATLKDEIISFASGKFEFQGESINRKLNGEVMHILIRGSIVPGYEDTWEKVLISISDITSQVRTEHALRQANKKLNLLSGITRHDILNQVAILEGYLDLAGEEVTSPGLKEYMEHLEQAVKTIQRQIEFTREYQEIGVNAATWQNIRSTVMIAARAFSQEGVDLIIECSDVEIFADPLLQKMFYNLFDNAYRYAPPFSTITVSCSETDQGLSVVFADDGTGIAPEDKKHLFERGFGKHTGLGLFLSREILAITGISITENGEPGKGARFEILVPKGAYRTCEKTGPEHTA